MVTRSGAAAAPPTILVQEDPLYPCHSPLSPQFVQYTINPADAEVTGIKFRSASVMRGGKNPFVVDTTSNCAD